MSLYTAYSWHRIFLRRITVIVIGALMFPALLFWRDRARFYSYLHCVWLKTSDKPVWLAQSESVINDLY
ncbi:YbfA family protein [Pectobacteriaceae bacterium CE70]|uniref:DUF2517 domain-containing protein n=1 Tax=Serratia sp. (strain ATCC 39006) TaxID=104623 RepID=A0A2I5TAE8_SERS3|nr:MULTISPECIES: YbfA family protein [Enterobacterales]WJV63807.1 YbfA family protein [Pectobacteriaceae bacterium C52]WJV68206.1 YbfA family protein [Pectobacteriaceae bacterium CE70]WJY12141.1 YbfA family protein [Pectobacteriaceae bacterium C80]AUH01560.1 DUF2517 domain-containing protein [Serratia sp. ATCC 39006]AUH05883.1 DUF2517 domain-containing protein [Serratia sp. ATCC 39006]